MDFLFHLSLAVAGGYVFLNASGTGVKYWHVVALGLAAQFPDLMHFVGRIEFLHNVFVFIPLFLILFYFAAKKKIPVTMHAFAFILMVAGHMLFDMVFGTGIALFYPLSTRLYVLPQFGLCMYGGGLPHIVYGSDLVECIFTPIGLAVFVYFAAAFAIGYFLRR